MKISQFRIHNVLGIKDLEFAPGGFTEISGRNGAGKSSALEAIKAAIRGGHDATLLRQGADKGEVVLVLDDGTEITKRIRQGASDTVVTRDGQKLPRPAEAIKALTDLLSVNPLEFLRAPKKDRVKVLLEAMPLQADVARLQQITGIPVSVSTDAHALDVIQAVYQQVYDDRTGTNRAVREKEATINQLRAAMPEVPAGAEEGEDAITAAIEAAGERRQAEFDRIAAKLDGLRAQHDAEVRGLQEQIEALQQQIAASREKFADIRSKAEAQRGVTTQKHDAEVAPLKERLQVIRANRNAVAKREQTEAVIAKMAEEAQVLQADAERQTKALADLEAYKSELLNSLPIPGLEVRDGEVYRNGILFDRLNTAQQVQIAVEIAKLRAGKLGVICVDGIELLDADAYEAFREQATQTDLQMFVTRVGDGELTLRSDN